MRKPGVRFFTTTVNSALIVAVVVIAVIDATGGITLEGEAGTAIRDLLWFALLCGLASSATIEILKRVFSLRGLYQMRQTEVWLADRAKGGTEPFDQLLDVMGLKPGPEAVRVFNLPTEQLIAQIGVATDVLLARQNPDEPLNPLIVALAGQHASARGEGSDTTALAQSIEVGVDHLQISLSERWRGYVQSAALWIAGAYGIALVETADISEDADSLYMLAALLIGGMIAWSVRDLAAVLERARR
jgi:hypothetical protein